MVVKLPVDIQNTKVIYIPKSKMRNYNFITLFGLTLLCLISKNANSQIIVEGFYNQENGNEPLVIDIGSNGTNDSWETLNAATVSASALFKSPTVQFIIRTPTSIRRIETYHFTTLKFRNLTSTVNETIWHGSLKPINAVARRPTKRERLRLSRRRTRYRTGFASIYERSGRIRTATFTTATAVYDMVYNKALQSYSIRSRQWQDFPKEVGISPLDDNEIGDVPPAGSSMNVSFAGSQILQLSNQSWFSIESTSSPLAIPLSRKRSRQLKNSNIFSRFSLQQRENIRDLAMLKLRTLSDSAQLRMDEDNRNEDSSTSNSVVTVDVLVVVSHLAMCEYSFGVGKTCSSTTETRSLITGRMKVVESETNNALKSVNLAIRFVQVIFLDKNGWDPIAQESDLDVILSDTQINQWRDDAGADLIAVVGKSGGYCGIATLRGHRSITNQVCLGQYTMTHEIGHNFGAHHDKANAKNNPTVYAHGYQKNGSYRSVMSYDCSNSCPRVPYFSSETIKLPDGRTIGSSTEDNMRQIQERGPSIAQYRIAVPIAPTPTPKPATTKPTKRPTKKPTKKPSKKPTKKPTSKPTWSPRPAALPTSIPTATPTITRYPSSTPSQLPSISPTNQPTVFLACKKTTCRGGKANLMYRRYKWFGRERCMSSCVEQARMFLFSTTLGFKCGKC